MVRATPWCVSEPVECVVLCTACCCAVVVVDPWSDVVLDSTSEPRFPTDGAVSVVIPVFGGQAALRELVDRLHRVLAAVEHEVILVDDASPDPVADIARTLAERDARVRLLRLARNSGQHAALLAGVRAARYGITLTLDDDLQNPPEEIPKLLDRLRAGGADVVYGYSPKTSHAWWRRSASSVTRWTIGRLLGAPSAVFLSPFRAFRTDLRHAFDVKTGPGVSLDVLLGWGTSKFDHVDVEHQSRTDGASGYTMRRLVRFAFDVLTGYSTALLNLVSWLGLITTLLGVGILAWVVGRWLTGGISVAGFPFLASSIAIFSGAQMLSVGIIGQYIGRMHVRIQGRPAYHIVERID